MISRIALLILVILSAISKAMAAPVQFMGAETGTLGDEIQLGAGIVSVVTSPVKTGTYAYRANPTSGGGGSFRIYCVAAAGSLSGCSLTNAYIKFD